MDLKTALHVLDEVCSVFKGTREEHQTLLEALKTVKAATDKNPSKEKEK